MGARDGSSCARRRLGTCFCCPAPPFPLLTSGPLSCPPHSCPPHSWPLTPGPWVKAGGPAAARGGSHVAGRHENRRLHRPRGQPTLRAWQGARGGAPRGRAVAAGARAGQDEGATGRG
eukprot:358832-Chlamydomonas_euryale.AAC.5